MIHIPAAQATGPEGRRALGLDVEYAHFKNGAVRAAEVCLVEHDGRAIWHSFCYAGMDCDLALFRVRCRCADMQCKHHR